MQRFGLGAIVVAGVLACSACGDDPGAERSPKAQVGDDPRVPEGPVSLEAGRPTQDNASPSAHRLDAGSGAAEAGSPTSDVGTGAPVIVKSGTHGWNELRGAMLGDGRSRPTQLRKPLNVTLEGNAAGYMTGSAFATRNSPASKYVSLIVLLRNQGTATRCFVQSKATVWKAADGQVVHTTGGSYITASNARDRDGDILTNTCLAPGETGYINEFEMPDDGERPLFDSLTTASLTLSDSSGEAYAPPAFMAVPQSYTVAGDVLKVTFANVGTEPAPIHSGSLVEYILLDEEGLPVDYGYLDVDLEGSVQPNGTFTATDTYSFEGVARGLLINLSY